MQHRNTARATLSAETHRWRFPVLAVTPGLTRAMLTYMSIGKNVQDVAFPRRRVLVWSVLVCVHGPADKRNVPDDMYLVHVQYM